MAQKKRDTYKYDFVDKRGKILHSGITKDLERREPELKRKYGQTGHTRQVGRRTTEEAARAWEKGKRKA